MWEYVRRNDLEDFFKKAIERELGQDAEPVARKDELYDALLRHNGIKRSASRNPQWIRAGAWVAAAAVIVLIASLWIPVRQINLEKSKASGENHLVYNQQEQVFLPDGSSVYLKANSELTALFENGRFTRQVSLKGEAFFDIKRNPDTTFVVHTGAIQTRVLGTAFNIRTDGKETEVIVTRGMVEVSDPVKNYGKLTRSDRITIGPNTTSLHKLSKEETALISMDLLPLVFEESSMEYVMTRVGERFGVQIEFDNPDLKKCRVSAGFTRGETLDDILNLLSQMRHASFERRSGVIRITGGKPCN